MRARAFWIAALAAMPAFGQEGEDARSKREEILSAIRLPASAQALRDKGVEKAEVKEALRAAKEKRLKARNTKALLDESAKAVDENGRIDNFGSFVKSKLAEGLRGRELAQAIRAEHQSRGKGKGKEKSRGRPEDTPTGKPDDESAGRSKGKPEDKGKPEREETESDTPKDTGPKGNDPKGKGKGKQR